MNIESPGHKRSVVVFGPPGGYPGVANLGLEIVVDSVKNNPAMTCDAFRSDIMLCRLIHPDLLNKIANLDVMDFFHAEYLWPRFCSAARQARMQRYLLANGVTSEECSAVKKALRELRRLFRRYINQKRPKVLAVSLNSDRFITALHFVRIAKRIIPDITVVFGGAAVQGDVGTSIFETFSDIDYLVTGRGERVAAELFHRILSSKDTDTIQGALLSRREGTIIRHPERSDRHPYPLPEMDEFYEELIRLTGQYGRASFGTMYGIAVTQSAGCWWGKCDFCSEPDHQRGYILADSQAVAAYIRRTAQRHHLTDVFFMDSIQPPAHYLRNLCRELSRDPVPYRISSEIHASIDDRTLDLLLKSGFKTFQIGIESYSQDLLDAMNKGIALIDLFAILVRFARESVTVQGNIIMHHPRETKDTVRETIQVMRLTSHLFTPSLQHYFVAPGSRLENDLSSEGVRTYPMMKHTLLYPRNLRDRLVFFYRYLPENRTTYPLWRRLLQEQANLRQRGRPLLVYIEGAMSVQIIDTRFSQRKSYYLTGLEKEILLACSSPRTVATLCPVVSGNSAEKINEGLNVLVNNGVLLRQGERYLTLAIPWKNRQGESV